MTSARTSASWRKLPACDGVRRYYTELFTVKSVDSRAFTSPRLSPRSPLCSRRTFRQRLDDASVTTPPSTAAPTPSAPMPITPSAAMASSAAARSASACLHSGSCQRVLARVARGEVVAVVELRDRRDVTPVARLHGVAPLVRALAQKLHRARSAPERFLSAPTPRPGGTARRRARRGLFARVRRARRRCARMRMGRGRETGVWGRDGTRGRKTRRARARSGARGTSKPSA